MENKISDNQHIWMLFRLRWTNNRIVTIGKLIKLNKEDKDYLFEYILEYMENKSDYYREQALKSMIFSYTIKKGKAKDKIIIDNTDLTYQNFQHHKLPITMDPLKYGLLLRKQDNVYTIQINDTNMAIIIQYDKYNEVEIFRKGKGIYKYKDYKIDEYTFERHLGNQKFTFKNGELVYKTIEKLVKFINPLLANTKLTNKIITFDIETLIKDNIHVPYAISWYDSEIKKSYVLSDISNSEEMIKNATIKKGRAKDKITFDNKDLRYQFFNHHKLPVTMNPLEYGKLLEQIDNKYTIQVNKTNVAIITQFNQINEVKFHKEGDLIYTYKDHKIDENTFVRSLDNNKFVFKDNELVLSEINKYVKFINHR